MTEHDSGLDFSSYSDLQMALESIGASAWKALSNLRQSQLAANYLLQAYFENHAEPRYEQLEEEAVHLHWKDLRRSVLLTAIGILDSFLSDALRLLFLHAPTAVPSKAPKQEAGESGLAYIERVVRRYFSSQNKRIKFLSAYFKLNLDQGSIAELAAFTELRNEIAHHSGFYRFTVDPRGGILVEDRILPGVSQDDATKVSMNVTEICDAIMEGMSINLFGQPPKVRPLPAELASLFQRVRREWTEKESTPAEIEEYPEPGWSEKVLSDPSLPWVGDDHYAFIVRPTGLDNFPVMIDFLWNKQFGSTALVSVDGRPLEKLTNSQELLDQMLGGDCILVKFHDDRQDSPRYARFSLSGFAEAWHTAWENKKRSSSGAA